jgi:iron complex outermembrane recepter protein
MHSSSSRHSRKFLLIPCIAFTVTFSVFLTPVAVSEETDSIGTESFVSLTEMSLEHLMDIEITSVSREKEQMVHAPAAIYVLTNEDIRRSGATSIPEVLRLVPGVNVARLNANRWAITVRGFNGLYAQKLLVLVDGRTVYSPLFSGVHWQLQDLMLEDVDRIEVIRGPGAAMWGANAVNGVINIITKSAEDTEGGLLTVGGGTTQHFFHSLRYGMQCSETIHLRIYEKVFDHGSYESVDGGSGNDHWRMLRTGFRMDWEASPSDHVTVQGDAYGGEAGQHFTVPRPFPPLIYKTGADYYDLHGGNLLTRWTRSYSDGSEFILQTYYDHNYRDEISLTENRHTFDIDFQHRFQLGERNEITWGGGYRFTDDNIEDSYSLVLNPRSRSENLFRFFLSDRIALIEDKLLLTLGFMLEHNDYTGIEFQPNARLQWLLDDRHSLWAAVSRAVQTPFRGFSDQRINVVRLPLGVFSLLGNKHGKSEDITAYEIGYRVKATKRLFLDATLFFNTYDDLRTREFIRPFFELRPFPPHFVIPLEIKNNMKGEVYGLELAADWQVYDNWRLAAAYSLLQMDLWVSKSSRDTNSTQIADKSPQHQFNIRSYLNISPQLEFDTLLYFVDSLPGYDIDSYIRMDAYLRWLPRDNLEFAVGIQNMLDSQHQEFSSREGIIPTEVEREVYGKITWRF